MKKKLQIGILVAVLSAGLAQAQQAPVTRIYREGGNWVEEISGSLPAARNLKLKADMGNVRVQGGAQGITFDVKLRVSAGSEESARRRLESFRISATRQGETAVIVGDCRGDCPRNASAEFVLNVPSDTAQIELETGGGNLSASALNGTLAAETGGGNMRLDGLGGPVSASSGGGTVVVDNGNSAVVVETGGGGIHVTHVGGALKVNTGGGNIDIGDAGAAVIAETGGGGIHLGSARGQVRAETGGGNLELWGVAGGVRTETGSGSITVELVSGGSFSDSSVETGSGDIVVYLSPGLHATVRAASEFCSGKGIVSDFSELQIRSEGGEYGPHEVYADGSLNGGGPLLKIRTSNGSIQIHRGKK